ncbi:MAG: DUF5777 family beta-barrel protein [Arcicella sp.]|jgi:hypothetical protein|nr:DUF5777 family beta-barrel protein [Arcicella sp.]
MKKLFILLIFFCATPAFSQDDLMKILDAESKNQTDYTTATFKGTRLINGQTIETVSKNHLNFWISHRFGALNSGFIDNFFGLDEARIRLGLEYGITDLLTVGIGRSSQEKMYDFYAKYKLLRQSNTTPLTVTLYGSNAISTVATGSALESGTVMRYKDNLERMTYTGQVLLARKFSESVSLQLMPTFIHFNKAETTDTPNDMVALGVGGRVKLSKRVSLSAEYYYADFNRPSTSNYHNALALGFDIETGGHVFQLHFTNARGMIERQFIAQTTKQWSDGGIFYGFNIARSFSFDKRAKGMNK